MTRNIFNSLTLVPLVNEIRAIYPQILNKEFLSKFCVVSRVWHKTLEGTEGASEKRCEYNNEDKDNRMNSLSHKERTI